MSHSNVPDISDTLALSLHISFSPLALDFAFLQRANILKEVQIMRGLTHPSIVRLFDFTESREHYFLTLEYVIIIPRLPRVALIVIAD